MKYSLFTNQIKRRWRATLLLLVMLFNLSPGGTITAYAAPPSNDNFGSATLISSIPYNNSISTLEATAPPSDPQVDILCDNKLLVKGLATVWYKHKPTKNTPISIDTIGSNYDTYVAVWRGPDINNLTLVACDDDNNDGFQSQMAFAAKAGVTYYIEVAQYNGTRAPSKAPEKPVPALRAVGGSLSFHVRAGANVEVRFAGVLLKDYLVAAKSSKKASFPATEGGPAKVLSLQSVKIVASKRVGYSPDGGTTWPGFSEMMGLPTSQLHTSYVFPWYNNVTLDSQLLFANVGTTNTSVTVKIGNVINGPYTLKPNDVKRLKFALNKGPVRVTSSGGVKIIASMRVAYSNGTNTTSYSEMMGLPANKLTNSYIFPWYDNVTLDSQMRFANMDTANTNVTVRIGNVVNGPYTLKPGQVKQIKFAGLNKGPVRVTSSGGAKILASMRVIYFDGTNTTSFSELMGLPANAAGTRYALPLFTSVNLNSQLRFANIGTANTQVKVFIGGQIKGTYNLLPNTARRVTNTSLDNGPIVVQSSGGIPIVASLGYAYTPDGGTTWTNFSEMMGLPQTQWATTYIFPWYNNKTLNSQLRFGVP